MYNLRKFGKSQSSSPRGLRKELNTTTSQRPDTRKPLLAIPITWKGKTANAMIDSGATGNFISAEWVRQNQVHLQRKRKPYYLTVADGSEMPTNDGRVALETEPLRVVSQQHHMTIAFDVVRLANHDIILGMPWLRQQNPQINWIKGTIRYAPGSVTREPTQQLNALVDEEERIPNSESPEMRSNRVSTSLGRKGYHDDGKGRHEPLDIPEQYKKWEHLFQEEMTIAALPKHQPWDHEIELMPGKQPTFGPIYQLSEKELGVLRDYLKENLKKGFIRESKSPAGYPILFAPKKDGSLRLCVDYRKLNDITIKNRYPLPNIGELQDRLARAKIFTKLDLRGAYNLIRVKEGEEWKTAFRTRYGHYEYLVMPFGLTNAPATCQTLINNVIRAHLDRTAIAYLDDILVYSESEEEHKKHVNEILDCLSRFDLKLKPEKCEFHRTTVTFLGFIISTEGIRMDNEKIKAVQEWPKPRNLKEVQQFLGFVNYNRRFIQGYSKEAKPLTELTKKDRIWSWNDKEEKAFQFLKGACIQPPLLKTFDSSRRTKIETDASDFAIGACLAQEHDGRWHPVAYHSRGLTTAEGNYDIYDKELLSIVDAFKHWRVYAESSTDLVVYSDHKNLTYFTTTKQLKKRHVRWSECLSQFKFRIIYTPGRENGRADALSRRPDLTKSHEPRPLALLTQNKDGSLGPPGQLNVMATTQRERNEEWFEWHYNEEDRARNLTKGANDILVYKGKTYIPNDCVQVMITDHHDGPENGHPGVAKTLNLIRNHYDRPGLEKEVREYIKKCSSCQKNKADRHVKYGLVQFAQVPHMAWQDITLDFITKLPKSEDPITKVKYDSILVIVDRLTKYSLILPFKETYTAEDLGSILVDRLVRDHGMPESITSDRDKLFTSKYWRTMTAQLGINHKLSTAYHPQTDGQTERTNQTLEQYLRHYINQKQDNWVQLLPMAQLAINRAVHETTKLSPFFANYGKEANVFQDPKTGPNAARALIAVRQLKDTQETIAELIKATNETIARIQNKTRKEGPQLKEGDKVYLRTKNLRSKRRSKKLDHVKVGPFLVKKVKGPNNIELDLPKDARVHPVFHISLIEPADPETPLQETFRFKPDEEEYDVEKIMDQQGSKYLVKWLDCDESENTWETKTNLRRNCSKILTEWENRKKQQLNMLQARIPVQKITKEYSHRRGRRDTNEWIINNREVESTKFCICGRHGQTRPVRRRAGLGTERTRNQEDSLRESSPEPATPESEATSGEGHPTGRGYGTPRERTPEFEPLVWPPPRPPPAALGPRHCPVPFGTSPSPAGPAAPPVCEDAPASTTLRVAPPMPDAVPLSDGHAPCQSWRNHPLSPHPVHTYNHDECSCRTSTTVMRDDIGRPGQTDGSACKQPWRGHRDGTRDPQAHDDEGFGGRHGAWCMIE
jgi:RNase H-like domain found in reverse transcriptase/Reverse transcriptase (RNA-dependent DNA polymerase)/Integrase zinc binding domain/Aspartyl protease/Chromo (CHRromatin Organisation MOdifier) domain